MLRNQKRMCQNSTNVCKTHYIIQINYEKVGEFHLIIQSNHVYHEYKKRFLIQISIIFFFSTFTHHLHIRNLQKSKCHVKCFCVSLSFPITIYNNPPPWLLQRSKKGDTQHGVKNIKYLLSQCRIEIFHIFLIKKYPNIVNNAHMCIKQIYIYIPDMNNQ